VSLETRYAAGIDVGGTFTDLVVTENATGRQIVAKVPTTPENQSIGVINGLREVAAVLSHDLPGFMERMDHIVLGTTVATNIMLEMNGAVTGILATRGHRDTIDVRRNYKEADFDIRLPAPYPIAPRRRRYPVTERVDSGGQVVTPLDEDDVRVAIEGLLAQDVESIAVCYLFSFLNPSHEVRTGEIIKALAPGLHVSLSHQVLPRVREFERLSTTLVDAYVSPGLDRYLHRLETSLAEMGFAGELFVMAANGGMVSVDFASRHGVQTVLSGPAGGIVGSVRTGTGLAGKRIRALDLITIDMGGTSFDTCLVKDAQPITSTEAWINRYRVAIPVLDIQTFGAGGGSIAWVDEGGKLRVGPQSAGAVPGPACYSRGGTLPAVTDADVFLGMVGDKSFLGGSMPLDRRAAEAAIRDQIALPLGMDVDQAAAGIVEVVNNSMANGIVEVSRKRGVDPRDFTIIAFGGAGPVHAGRLAQHLGIRRVIVPRKMAPVFSALGCVLSDVRISKAKGLYARSSQLDLGVINRLLEETLREARTELGAIQSVVSTRVEVSFEMHYKLQTHETMIAADLDHNGGSERVTAESMAATLRRFHDTHMELFTFNKPEQEVEILGIQVDVWGFRRKQEPVALNGADRSVALEAFPSSHRRVYFDEYGGFRDDVPVYVGESLPIGSVMVAPSIVEEPHTTIVVYPGMSLEVIDSSAYELTVQA
jgi:N-methylhydantoinase A